MSGPRFGEGGVREWGWVTAPGLLDVISPGASCPCLNSFNFLCSAASASAPGWRLEERPLQGAPKSQGTENKQDHPRPHPFSTPFPLPPTPEHCAPAWGQQATTAGRPRHPGGPKSSTHQFLTCTPPLGIPSRKHQETLSPPAPSLCLLPHPGASRGLLHPVCSL